jgi:hypothetical protein
MLLFFKRFSTDDIKRYTDSVYTNLYGIPRNSASHTIPLYFSLVFLYLNFHLMVYGILYLRTYTEYRRISRYCTLTNFEELREIKSIQHKIPYSAEFQKGTSENTLIQALSNVMFLSLETESNTNTGPCNGRSVTAQISEFEFFIMNVVPANQSYI